MPTEANPGSVLHGEEDERDFRRKLSRTRRATGLVEMHRGDQRVNERYPIALELQYKLLNKGREHLGVGRTLNVSSGGVLFEADALLPATGPIELACEGSGYENVRGTFLPHSEFGNPDCCGCLNGVINGDWADIVCDECDAVIRTVSAADLQNTFDEMELTLDVASEICPHCGAVNLFSGFSRMMAFTCRHCGKAVLC